MEPLTNFKQRGNVYVQIFRFAIWKETSPSRTGSERQTDPDAAKVTIIWVTTGSSSNYDRGLGGRKEGVEHIVSSWLQDLEEVSRTRDGK